MINIDIKHIIAYLVSLIFIFFISVTFKLPMYVWVCLVCSFICSYLLMVHVDFWQGKGMGTENLYNFNLARTEVCITMSKLWWLSIYVTIVIHFSPVSVLRLGGFLTFFPCSYNLCLLRKRQIKGTLASSQSVIYYISRKSLGLLLS